MSETSLPSSVVDAARALGVPTDLLSPIGGRSGQSWACGDDVLRLGARDRLRVELAAMSAVGGGVSVPRVLVVAEYDAAEGTPMTAALLSRLPGRPAGDLEGLTPEEAFRRGSACGRLHAMLAVVTAPSAVPPVAGAASSGTALLHLDLHPLNVLVDDANEVTGVVDWANAAQGPAVLDRARTWSILTLDPAARARRGDPRWEALVAGWSAAAMLDRLPADARAWACRLMLDDLAERHTAEELQHVRDALP